MESVACSAFPRTRNVLDYSSLRSKTPQVTLFVWVRILTHDTLHQDIEGSKLSCFDIVCVEEWTRGRMEDEEQAQDNLFPRTELLGPESKPYRGVLARLS